MAPSNNVSSTARILRPIILCLLLAGAAGCGFKGPLYLPDAPPADPSGAAPEETGPEQRPEHNKEQDEDRDDTAAGRAPAAA